MWQLGSRPSAHPGGIYVSRAVRDHLLNRPDLVFDKIGVLNLKNIAQPVETFALGFEPTNTLLHRELHDGTTNIKSPPSKPSIAVLRFINMTSDPEQEYFSDGVADDIITELSRSHSLFVIARNSSFAYKGGTVGVGQVGRELGVRYVVQGSVRRSGSRIRVTAQLVETETGNHIWAERYDCGLEDISRSRTRSPHPWRWRSGRRSPMRSNNVPLASHQKASTRGTRTRVAFGILRGPILPTTMSRVVCSNDP